MTGFTFFFFTELGKGSHTCHVGFANRPKRSRYFDHFFLIVGVFLFYIQPEAFNVSVFAACRDCLHPPQYKFGGLRHKIQSSLTQQTDFYHNLGYIHGSH